MEKTDIYFETYGNINCPAVFLVSGLGGQLSSWNIKFIDELVNQDFYVIAIDNRDSGLSKKYDNFGTYNISEILNYTNTNTGNNFTPPYTLGDMALDLYNLMQVLSIKKAHIVGISMGGIIAQIFCINYSKSCLSMICIGATSGEPKLSPPKKEVLEYLLSNNRKITSVEEYIEDKLNLYKIYNTNEDLDEEQLYSHYAKTYNRSFYPSGINRQMLALILEKPRTEQLKNLFVPSLIIHGTHDPVFPLDHGQHLAECLPNSKLEIVKNLGHGFPERLWRKVPKLISEYK